MHSLTKELSLSRKNRSVLECYLLSLPSVDGRIRLDQIFGLVDNLLRAVKEKDPAFLEQRRGYRFSKIVDVIEFAESREYLGQRGGLWPSTLDNLWQIFHGPSAGVRYGDIGAPPVAPFEAVLSGCAGGGKSTTSWISLAYILYQLKALFNPHLEFSMMDSSTIFLTMQSVRLSTVQDALFNKLKYAVDASPWFKAYAPRNPDINSALIFSGGIEVRSLTGAVDASLGMDIFASIITEINAMAERKESVRLTNSDKAIYKVGEDMYNIVRNRIETRFSQASGGYPGKLIIDSAREHTSDFTSVKLAEQAEEIRLNGYSTILVIQRAIWDAKPGYENEPRFPVELGNDYKPARILQTEDQADNPDDIMWVPERHRKAMTSDIEKALKDLAGIPSCRTGKWFPFSEPITAAQRKFTEINGDQQLFLQEDISLRQVFADGQDKDWTRILNLDYLKSLQMSGDVFACHVDTSQSVDATGVAVGRIVGTTVLESGHIYDRDLDILQEVKNAVLPIFRIDGVLRIHAQAGERIDLNIVQDLVLELRRYINVKYASADWLESATMISTWRQNGIYSDHVSVDIKPFAYFTFQHAVRDGRIMFPPHKVLDTEIRQLQRIIKGGRIKCDHPANGSKDCSDAVAGVIVVLKNCEHVDRQAPAALEGGAGNGSRVEDESGGEYKSRPVRVSRGW